MPLSPPQRDAQGEVIPHDHPGITSDDGVLRRVAPHHYVSDPKATDGKRLSTMAFQASTGANGGMSVDLQKLIEEASLDPKLYVVAPPWIGAVRFTCGALRGEGFSVGYDPLPNNPYHGEVWGSFTRAKKQRLVALAVTFVLASKN